MAVRCRPLTAALCLVVICLGLVIGYTAVSRRHKSDYLAIAEYWVYIPSNKMPSQDEIMTLMVRDNPYHRRGVSPIGPAEGILFSDVRLHMALVLRSKNPHVFRPDQFDDHIRPAKELVDALKQSVALVKIRFASDIPLKDKRHLQFLLHAADAVAEVAKATVLFDLKAELLLSRIQVQKILRENFDATGPEIHTDVVWKQTLRTGRAETRGLTKIGVHELQTGDLEPDQQVIAVSVLTEAVRCIWDKGALPEAVEVAAFGDTFRLQFEKMKDKVTPVKILRVQEI